MTEGGGDDPWRIHAAIVNPSCHSDVRLGVLWVNGIGGTALRFCPPSLEEDTRTVFDLGSADEISLGELLSRLDALGLKYEESLADNVVHKCENVESVANARSYKVYAGVDVSMEFSRNYLVVAEESGAVRYIEARHAYRAP